jgi:hypothetical protein
MKRDTAIRDTNTHRDTKSRSKSLSHSGNWWCRLTRRLPINRVKDCTEITEKKASFSHLYKNCVVGLGTVSGVCFKSSFFMGTRCKRSWLRHDYTSWRSRVQFPMRLFDFFLIYPILPAALWPWSRLSLYQKRVPGNFLGGKGRSAHKAGNITAICGPSLYKMWEPRRFTTLWVSIDLHVYISPFFFF